MKKLVVAAAMAVTAVAGVAVTTTAANAQPPGRYWHGPARGPGWHDWRRSYYGRWHRYPVRTCHRGHCWYR